MSTKSRGPSAAIASHLDAILALPRPVLLAFDVDGTLAPIVRIPSRAKVPAATVNALRRLSEAKGVRLAVVTGRDPEALARMLPFDGMFRGVLHGKVILAPGTEAGPLRLSAREQKTLAAFEQFARAELERPGVWLEPKPGALGVHTRALEQRDPKAARLLLARAREQAEQLGLYAREGRAIVEVETRSGDKGEALSRIHRRCRTKSAVFLGDDVTDVPALRFATEHGVGLFVRSAERPRRPPGLTGALPGTAEVQALVLALAAAFEGKG